MPAIGIVFATTFVRLGRRGHRVHDGIVETRLPDRLDQVTGESSRSQFQWFKITAHRKKDQEHRSGDFGTGLDRLAQFQRVDVREFAVEDCNIVWVCCRGRAR